VDTSVVQNAVGTLDKLLSEAKAALTQVQVALGYQRKRHLFI
jgi:hypothetical protein